MMRLVAVLALVCYAPCAHSQTSGGDDESRARADFRRGEELYASGQYDEAATYYLKAYNASARPALLFNAGQAYRLAGLRDAAIAQYRRYLVAVPEGEMSDVARTHLSQLLEEREGSAGPAPAPRRQQDGSTSRTLGHVFLATGVLAGIGSGALALRARSINQDVIDHREGPWTDELLDERQRAESFRRYAIVGGIASGAALLTAAVLYATSSKADEKPAVVITPWLTNDGIAGIVVASP